ncbi:phosphotriesterase-related protein [Virgibacillus halotolerans]|uniref:phosphotriesterase family protein n=1 Tax=Virgibacillus halotolerans TaxID=1071053 RepID=UPI001961BD08|nr:phosphotriesterase [Virgibacillus halotolerans]MBM7599471.1 phosphotriesterase-related protein [Virgibacillus halotolerans]
MALINTVTGKVDSSKLGTTLVHEHLKVRSEAISMQFPHLYGDDESDFKKVIKELKEIKDRGVQTICDPTVMELGRDIRFMERAAREVNMNVIAATGIYTVHYITPYLQNRSIDFLAELFVRDIEVGIQNTSIKAGFLKAATDELGFTPDVIKVLRAVARAHKKTNVPIMVHSHPDSQNGLKQLEIFKEEGVDPRGVLIAHCGDTDNLDYLIKILDQGAFIGMDRYASGLGVKTEQRNATVAELAKRGYSDQMFLSHDYNIVFDFFTDEMFQNAPDWSLTYIFDKVLPDLQERGVTKEQIKTIMVDNVRRWVGE